MSMQTSLKSGFHLVGGDSLPIFSTLRGDRAIFYTPRLVCVLDKRNATDVLRCIERLGSVPYETENPLEQFRGDSSMTSVPCEMENPHPVSRSRVWGAAVRLVRGAREAVREATEVCRQEFAPECLTLYVNNRCNMKCRYCYSQPGINPDETVSPEGVRGTARLVAGMCATRNVPFTLAFHGGGEPTLDVQLVDLYLDLARDEAKRFGLRPRTYIATNGVVSEETARWLVERFDLVGVSCDGPPDIQDRGRPGINGESTSEWVGRTMAILHREGRDFHVRVTLTRETIDRQTEIVEYLADCYGPREIRLEPVYRNPSIEERWEPSDVEVFVGGFLEAQETGLKRGVVVGSSITRLDALYGPYCNVLRRVLNVAPGDVGTGCFLCSRPVDIVRRGVKTGSFDSKRGVFQMDTEQIHSLIGRCSRRPMGCRDCPCSYQCTFGCPDRCVLEDSEFSPFGEDGKGGFRCRVNRMLQERMIEEASDEGWTRSRGGGNVEFHDEKRKLNVAVYRDEPTDEARS